MSDTADRRPAFARWLHSALSILIIVETVALLPLAIVSLVAADLWNGPIVLFAVDVCALPVTVAFVMIIALKFGDGLVFPFPVPSREEQKRFRRELGDRSPMTDDEFYERFYASSSHPKHLVYRVRLLLMELFDRRVARCRPDECLFALIPMDSVDDLVSELESAFAFRSSDRGAESGLTDEPHPCVRSIDDWLCHVKRRSNGSIAETGSTHAGGNA